MTLVAGFTALMASAWASKDAEQFMGLAFVQLRLSFDQSTPTMPHLPAKSAFTRPEELQVPGFVVNITRSFRSGVTHFHVFVIDNGSVLTVCELIYNTRI